MKQRGECNRWGRRGDGEEERGEEWSGGVMVNGGVGDDEEYK